VCAAFPARVRSQLATAASLELLGQLVDLPGWERRQQVIGEAPSVAASDEPFRVCGSDQIPEALGQCQLDSATL
jgi:hypothetical protein